MYKDNIQNKNLFRKNFNIDINSIVILFLGRFEHVKGVIEFSNAVKNIVKNKQIEVLIVGSGSLENKVKSIVKGLDQVHLFPWQPLKEIHKFYIVADIFVLPSKSEALPLTLIEAMNAGLHIAYTPVGGVPEFIEGYARKTLLKTSTNEEIQNILTKIISDYSINESLNEALSYARKFDWFDLAQETIKVYDKCQKHIK